ncbi:hypothetical protein IF2G_05598 [Cordyceps javanica]|nr:hypothetical protein IF2G_05598 [Cordyceps javanica]
MRCFRNWPRRMTISKGQDDWYRITRQVPSSVGHHRTQLCRFDQPFQHPWKPPAPMDGHQSRCHDGNAPTPPLLLLAAYLHAECLLAEQG